MTGPLPRRLGATGLYVSAVGLGTNNFGTRLDERRSHAVLDAAVELGVTLLDTADVYGFGASESIIGSWLASHRDEVVVATKVGMDEEVGGTRIGSSAVQIKRGVQDSLRRLRTDHVDLLQLHVGDPLTPLDETLRAVDDLVRAGAVRYVGVSNYAAWELARICERALGSDRAPIVSVQVGYSLLDRRVEDELIPACEALGVGLLAYRPLARGLLTGKYQPGSPPPEGTRLALQPEVAATTLTDENLAVVGRVAAYAAARDLTVVDVAMSWLLTRSAVTSILVGASSPEQLAANVAAATWIPSASDLTELEALLPPAPATDLGTRSLRRVPPTTLRMERR
jgi:aryl-alcohol dehydrogenase-like predicted oxidoreductase